MLRSISILTVAFPQTRRTRTFVEEGGGGTPAEQRGKREREREIISVLTQWGATLVIKLRERKRERERESERDLSLSLPLSSL
jgi:hypothetical protein